MFCFLSRKEMTQLSWDDGRRRNYLNLLFKSYIDYFIFILILIIKKIIIYLN